MHPPVQTILACSWSIERWFLCCGKWQLHCAGDVHPCARGFLTTELSVVITHHLHPPPPQNSFTTYWGTWGAILTWECIIVHSMIQLQIPLADGNGQSPVWTNLPQSNGTVYIASEQIAINIQSVYQYSISVYLSKLIITFEPSHIGITSIDQLITHAVYKQNAFGFVLDGSKYCCFHSNKSHISHPPFQASSWDVQPT